MFIGRRHIDRMLDLLESLPFAGTVAKNAERLLFQRHVRRLKNKYNEKVYSEFRGVVADGPFAGMYLQKQTAWGGDIAAMLMGEYELEVLAVIAGLPLREFDAFVDVGCANGYFAVGMVLRNPAWKVIAFDASDDAQETTRCNAQRNGVEKRIDIRGSCDPAALGAALEEYARPLIMIDVEGYEVALVDPVRVPALIRSDIIVELHDRGTGDIAALLSERCASTHDIRWVERSGRNPFLSKVLALAPDTDAWICISEDRVQSAGWMLMQSKRSACGSAYR